MPERAKKQYQRIIRECFWDLNMTPDDLESIINGHNLSQKKIIFNKILENSTHLFKDLTIFPHNDLEQLLKAYKVPSFNTDYFFRRKNLVEVYFFDKPLQVTELQWITS